MYLQPKAKFTKTTALFSSYHNTLLELKDLPNPCEEPNQGLELGDAETATGDDGELVYVLHPHHPHLVPCAEPV